jgi:hypothetical protein
MSLALYRSIRARRWSEYISFETIHLLTTILLRQSFEDNSTLEGILDDLALPPRPSDEWTRFVRISDTHSRAFDVPDGDVLLHSGDSTNTGTTAEFQKTMSWLYGLQHKIKMLVLSCLSSLDDLFF